jgi:hypothetical protein
MATAFKARRMYMEPFGPAQHGKVGAFVAAKIAEGVTQLAIDEENGTITVCWPAGLEPLEDQPLYA